MTAGFSQGRNRYKYEVVGGLGPTNFLGELGGANRIGTHFLRDFDLNSTRFCLDGGIRYKNHPYFAAKAMFAFAMLSGNDALTNEMYRHNRNLNFRSPILELSLQGEFYFLKEKTKKVYSISGLTGSKKRKRNLSAYLFAGVGVFYYNPKGKYNGTWYALRKLHTEGQGLPGGPAQYSNFNLCIPMGIGMKYLVNKKWSVGAEISVRKTFTDYIDDVSTRYYDKAALANAYGIQAAQVADPSLGEVKGATLPDASGTGAQRGDSKYKDAYMFLTVNVAYKITRAHRTRAKF
jgi:hypothetical protein